MADELQMDPARIARLRDPARLAQVDPMRIFDVAVPQGSGPIVDVGAGVGFVTLPAAKAFPGRRVVACDILEGMLGLLADAATEAGCANVETALMPGPASLPVDSDTAALVTMLQVHHELDDPVALLVECRRALAPGATIAIVDWKPDDDAKGRRVSAAQIAQDLSDAGFADIEEHDVYPVHSLLTAKAL